jgi:hypothetical protein
VRAGVAIVLGLLVVWGVLVAREMREAVQSTDLEARRRRARRLLLVVSLGVPLVLALIVVA